MVVDGVVVVVLWWWWFVGWVSVCAFVRVVMLVVGAVRE